MEPINTQIHLYTLLYARYFHAYPELRRNKFSELVSWMSDDDSLDVDITVSNSRSVSSALPPSPPPTSRPTSWLGRLQSRLAFCALCVFLLVFVVTVLVLLSSAQRAVSGS
ncbi:unnamed protein product, partial [Mesorhabditis spiculigera]